MPRISGGCFTSVRVVIKGGSTWVHASARPIDARVDWEGSLRAAVAAAKEDADWCVFGSVPLCYCMPYVLLCARQHCGALCCAAALCSCAVQL